MKGGKGRRRERGREVEKRRTKGGKVGKRGREGAEERIERGRERKTEGRREGRWTHPIFETWLLAPAPLY